MTKRLSINLPDKEAAELAEMQESEGLTATEIVRKAVLTQKFLRDEQTAGRVILLESEDGKQRQIVLI